jgi:hypothetical protein
MKRSEPTREILPVTPKPGLELVYKRFSRLSQGGIVCTVSYLESKKPIQAPAGKMKLLIRIAGVLNRFRGAVEAQLRKLQKVSLRRTSTS